MNDDLPDISRLAGLLADPGRSRMLLALLEGRMLPASDLARAANLSAQAASNHLARMLDGGVLRVENRGRYRYYALANSQMAHVIEALACAAHGQDVLRPTLRPKGDAELRLARTCYRHLAGQLGTQLCEAMQAHGYLQRDTGSAMMLTVAGADWLQQALGMDSGQLAGKACLDWSERRDHLAGPLGEAICHAFLAQGLVCRRPGRRSLQVTAAGLRLLQTQLGIQL
ncbi:helix-turn-helix transcriptional regulator [Vogesella sp. DC21W]|uniref:Helix-turn-helix transcriptional regulator n=1 Tax=Vogesella aquatica TaxID=2984206 RepID=A0ABT5J1T0_9NEIS|nr:helix-turn-helix transcriptional regulator [Vogesella aquatica]MDC7718781.1 helix-turn-helix transcriptional regulator [Vogesella aquatica]